MQTDAKSRKMTETLAHGYSPENTPINTNMTGLNGVSKIFATICFGKK